MNGHVTGGPKAMLRIEGAIACVISIVGYHRQGASWLLVPLVLFLPDLFMVGYAASTRVGAVAYNIGHTYVSPLVLGLAAVTLDSPGAKAAALIWVAHIGMDRALGYGLKYGDSFSNTHLGWLKFKKPKSRHFQ